MAETERHTGLKYPQTNCNKLKSGVHTKWRETKQRTGWSQSHMAFQNKNRKHMTPPHDKNVNKKHMLPEKQDSNSTVTNSNIDLSVEFA